MEIASITLIASDSQNYIHVHSEYEWNGDFFVCLFFFYVMDSSHWLARLLCCHPAASSSSPDMKVRSLGCTDIMLAEFDLVPVGKKMAKQMLILIQESSCDAK